MTLLVYFAVTLFVAVLISDLAEKSVLSVSVLFLGAGFLAGTGVLGNFQQLNPDLLQRVAELALFSVLFTDGMRTGGLHELRQHWRLAGRALLIGMPLTIAGVAVLARFLVGLSWPGAFLLGAVVSPTDPVFVSTIFRFDAIPERIKRLLNIESGLNDGLALPVVIILLTQIGGQKSTTGAAFEELALGGAIGVVVPWVGIKLEQSRLFGAAGVFQKLNAFALGVLVLGICYRTGANLFIAAFTAGITISTVSEPVREAFLQFGEIVAELLKLGALLLFGALIEPHFLIPLPGLVWVFVVLGVFAIRPVAIALSLVGENLSREEVAVAGWFGPKGFASVVYGLLILHRGLNQIAHLVGLMVVISIAIYSSTDILVGRWFQRRLKGQRKREERENPDISSTAA